MSPAVRVQAMQKPYRTQLWAQRRTRVIELDITILTTYEYAVNNVNCSYNVCVVQDPLKSGTELFIFGMGPI